MKKTVKFSSIAMLTVMTVNLISPTIFVSADETTSNVNQSIISHSQLTQTKDYSILSQEDIETIANKYISFNSEKQEFSLNNNIRYELSNLDIIDISNKIATTNKQLKEIIKNVNGDVSLFAVDPDGHKIALSPSMRAAGKNAVEIHWNYARIYLSKNSVNNIIAGGTGGLGALVGLIPGVGIGITVAVGIVLAIVGRQEVKNGIWFDYNYFTGIWTNNWGWQ